MVPPVAMSSLSGAGLACTCRSELYWAIPCSSHSAEGPFLCNNTTVQYNDVGPCGSDAFQQVCSAFHPVAHTQWSDGISLSCASSLVQYNTITDATDGGIVVFGAPFSMIRNNTVQVQTRTQLGGINMVDVLPWLPPGNYSHTVVENNRIYGGFANTAGNGTSGNNTLGAMIKIGIAVGPKVWFGETYGTNMSTGGTVQNNILSGAFAFGIAVARAQDFVITNNTFMENTTFIGAYGPNCSQAATEYPHSPCALLQESDVNINVTLGAVAPWTWENGTADSLTCFIPPYTNVWPIGSDPVSVLGLNATTSKTSGTSATSSASPTGTTVVGSPNSAGTSRYTHSMGTAVLLSLLVVVWLGAE